MGTCERLLGGIFVALLVVIAPSPAAVAGASASAPASTTYTYAAVSSQQGGTVSDAPIGGTDERSTRLPSVGSLT